MKLHSTRTNPDKPSVVKEYGYWWARYRYSSGGVAMSAHGSQPEAFTAASRMAQDAAQ